MLAGGEDDVDGICDVEGSDAADVCVLAVSHSRVVDCPEVMLVGAVESAEAPFEACIVGV